MRILFSFFVVAGLFVSGASYADSSTSSPDFSLKAAKLLPMDAAWRASLPRDPVEATNAQTPTSKEGTGYVYGIPSLPFS
jgi:hypothetical protein